VNRREVNLAATTTVTRRLSVDFGDGTAHHSDWYVRQIDDKLVLLHFDYYDELENQVQQVYDSISQPQA
jgi:hypothetical protein